MSLSYINIFPFLAHGQGISETDIMVFATLLFAILVSFSSLNHSWKNPCDIEIVFRKAPELNPSNTSGTPPARLQLEPIWIAFGDTLDGFDSNHAGCNRDEHHSELAHVSDQIDDS